MDLARAVRRWGSRLRHNSIDLVGTGTRFSGRIDVVNEGVIEIGQHCLLSSHPVRSHLVVRPQARIVIGDDVMISYGAGISAMRAVEIGSGTRIGPFCLIMDNDYHKAGDHRELAGTSAPIHIGRNVEIGARVTVLRGSRIGNGVRVLSGSCVCGVVPEGAVVAGVPASQSQAAPRVSFVSAPQ
jgi:acetyltransferase-like isoleucine patch superfamily enzyme